MRIVSGCIWRITFCCWRRGRWGVASLLRLGQQLVFCTPGPICHPPSLALSVPHTRVAVLILRRAPTRHLNDGSFPDGVPGHNGVTKAGMTFFARPLRTAGQFALVSNDTGRCLGLRPYAQGQEYAPRANVPMLLGCEEGDATQAWSFPNGANRVGAIQSAWAVGAGLNSTVTFQI